MMRMLVALCTLLSIAACSGIPPDSTKSTTVDFVHLSSGKTPALRAKTDFVVARTQREWDAAWQLPGTDQHGSRAIGISAAPAVQFSDRMVLGVVFPAGPDSCTDAEIVRVTRDASRLTVQYRGRRPEEEAVCLTSFFAPFVFVTVRKTDKDVTFVEVPGR